MAKYEKARKLKDLIVNILNNCEVQGGERWGSPACAQEPPEDEQQGNEGEGVLEATGGIPPQL